MRKIRYLLISSLLLMVFKTTAQVSFIGFDPPMCSFPVTDVYTYTNYAIGSHGYGYLLYRNGILILTKQETLYGGWTCLAVKFINDSTGFLVDYHLTSHVYKTTDYGTSWQLLTNGAHYYGLYVINANFIYVVFHDNSHIFLTRASDIQGPSYIIDDIVLDVDLFRTDSTLYNSICGNDSLHIKFKLNSDTVNYHINCTTHLTEINSEKTLGEINIYPNPATVKCTFTIPEEFKNKTKFTLQIFDLNGKLMQQTPVQIHQEQVKVNIQAEAKGMYNVVLSNGKRLYRGKIIFE